MLVTSLISPTSLNLFYLDHPLLWFFKNVYPNDLLTAWLTSFFFIDLLTWFLFGCVFCFWKWFRMSRSKWPTLISFFLKKNWLKKVILCIRNFELKVRCINTLVYAANFRSILWVIYKELKAQIWHVNPEGVGKSFYWRRRA